MLKGINRQVVEIAHPDSAYFERVLFFVKPEYSAVNEEKLRGKAQLIIRKASAPPGGGAERGRREKVAEAVKLILAASSGAVAAGVFFWLF